MINKGKSKGGDFLKISQSSSKCATIKGDVGKLLFSQISFARDLSVALTIPNISEPTKGISNSSKIAASTILETLNIISISDLIKSEIIFESQLNLITSYPAFFNALSWC